MPSPPSGRGQGGLWVWAEWGGLWGMALSWPDAGGERGEDRLEHLQALGEGALSCCSLRGRGLFPPSCPRTGEGAVRTPWGRRAFGGKGAS